MIAMDGITCAIADPVRRQIVEMLAAQPLTAGDIASRFAISRPAVSRHLRVLRECGLVASRVEGRHRIYVADTTALRPLATWIASLDRPGEWDSRLDALETEVHRARRQRRAEPTRKKVPA